MFRQSEITQTATVAPVIATQLVCLLATSPAFANFRPEFGNHSHPVGGLDAELTATEAGVVISTKAGDWRINPSVNRKPSTSAPFWMPDSATATPEGTPRVQGSAGFEYRPHTRGVERLAETGHTVIPLDGYRANDLVKHGGRVWAGTFGGVYVKVDGTFERRPDFPERIVALESWNDLLVFLTPEVVGAYNGEFLETTRLPGPTDNHISALLRDSNRLIVGTFNDGISVLDDEGWRHFEEDLPSRKVNSVARFGGAIWIGTSAGLAVLRDGELSNVEIPDWDKGISDFAVTQKHLYIAGGDRMGRYDGSSWTISKSSGRPFWQSATAYKGSMAVGGMEGLGHVQDAQLPAKPDLKDPWITAVAEVEGSLYFGTYDAGLYRFNPDGGIKTIDPNAWVTPRTLVSHEEKILVGTRGNGLRVIEGNEPTRTLDTQHGLTGAEVTAIATDGRGIWVGTRQGLSYLPRKVLEGTRSKDNVTAGKKARRPQIPTGVDPTFRSNRSTGTAPQLTQSAFCPKLRPPGDRAEEKPGQSDVAAAFAAPRKQPGKRPDDPNDDKGQDRK